MNMTIFMTRCHPSSIQEQLKVIAVYAGCMSLYGEASAVTAAPGNSAFEDGNLRRHTWVNDRTK